MLVKRETCFDGEYWCARGIGVDIFTQGKTLDELHENIKEAVACHYGLINEGRIVNHEFISVLFDIPGCNRGNPVSHRQGP